MIKEELNVPTRLVVCVVETGEWHLVCSVENYLLDNRQDAGVVLSKEELEESGYVFKYMSGLNPKENWYKIKVI